MLVPLHGFLEGDTLGLLVLVHDHQPVRDIATSLQQAATPRARGGARGSVYFRGTRLDDDQTIRDSGLEALDRVDVILEDP